METEKKDTWAQEPFVRVSRRILDHLSELGPIAIAIYVDLAKYANARTGKVTRAQQDIADSIGVTRKTVNKYIQLMEEVNPPILKVYRQGKRRLTGQYFVLNYYWLLDGMSVERQLIRVGTGGE